MTMLIISELRRYDLRRYITLKMLNTIIYYSYRRFNEKQKSSNNKTQRTSTRVNSVIFRVITTSNPSPLFICVADFFFFFKKTSKKENRRLNIAAVRAI